MDILKRRLPVVGPEGMSELKKIALRFEEKIYSAAVDQCDYLRKFSMKMLSMETKTQQNTSMNSQPGINQNSTDTGSQTVPREPLLVTKEATSPPSLEFRLRSAAASPTSPAEMPSIPEGLMAEDLGLSPSVAEGVRQTESGEPSCKKRKRDGDEMAQRQREIARKRDNDEGVDDDPVAPSSHPNFGLGASGVDRFGCPLVSWAEGEHEVRLSSNMPPLSDALYDRDDAATLQEASSSYLVNQTSRSMLRARELAHQTARNLLAAEAKIKAQGDLISKLHKSLGEAEEKVAECKAHGDLISKLHNSLGDLISKLHKPFIQSQSGIPEVSSSTQTGHNGADWQEEAYQKIQAMKEAHLAELQDFHLKISLKLQQPDLAKQSENYEKLKNFKIMLDRLVDFLQISKDNITPNLNDKVQLYERQIINLLTSNRRQKVIASQQQGQHPVGHSQNAPLHQPSQVMQAQQQDNNENQAQQMNMSSAVPSSMQHG